MKRMMARNASLGSIVAEQVTVAATRAERRTGLLNHTSLPRGEALWIVPSRGVHTFGMKFAIDVIALDECGVVIDCVPHMKPWRIRLPRRGTAGVLELPAGSIAADGIQLGHRIVFQSIDLAAADLTPSAETTDRSTRISREVA
ncbi:MAG: DUF192 domain-containing protein [Acidobacteria bacterium]|nr:DUF192 domain-containing protein [Acidobacteriota bacterium]